MLTLKSLGTDDDLLKSELSDDFKGTRGSGFGKFSKGGIFFPDWLKDDDGVEDERPKLELKRGGWITVRLAETPPREDIHPPPTDVRFLCYKNTD